MFRPRARTLNNEPPMTLQQKIVWVAIALSITGSLISIIGLYSSVIAENKKLESWTSGEAYFAAGSELKRVDDYNALVITTGHMDVNHVPINLEIVYPPYYSAVSGYTKKYVDNFCDDMSDKLLKKTPIRIAINPNPNGSYYIAVSEIPDGFFAICLVFLSVVFLVSIAIGILVRCHLMRDIVVRRPYQAV